MSIWKNIQRKGVVKMTERDEIGLQLLVTWKQLTEEHAKALEALLKALSSRDSMSQAEREKFEAEIDALDLHEKQQFNAAMAKAKALGLMVH
jgi:DNA-binding PadR family transcriptional regulator